MVGKQDWSPAAVSAPVHRLGCVNNLAAAPADRFAAPPNLGDTGRAEVLTGKATAAAGTWKDDLAEAREDSGYCHRPSLPAIGVNAHGRDVTPVRQLAASGFCRRLPIPLLRQGCLGGSSVQHNREVRVESFHLTAPGCSHGSRDGVACRAHRGFRCWLQVVVGVYRLLSRFPRIGRIVLSTSTLVSLALAAGAGQKWTK